MADARWEYDDRARRYRSKRTGRFLSASSAVSLRDDFQERRRADLAALTRRLADESITVQQWEAEMQRLVRQVHTVEYAFGRGGRQAMTDADRAALADLVRAQHGYLRQFAQDIADGTLSPGQIAARAKLYYGASVQAYERGHAAAWSVSLPAYPCDGGTACKANCRCRWQIVDKGDEIHATWRLQSGESCSGCRSRASQWAPLVIAKPSDGRIARLFRAVA